MLDFPRLANDKGIPFIDTDHHHVHEGWGQTHCPFCTDGSHGFHLGFNLSSGYFSCWRCGGKSNWEVLKALLPRDDIKKLIQEYSGRKRRQRAVKKKIRKRNARKPLKMKGWLRKPHRKYLINKNFDPDKLEEEWSLGSTGPLSLDWKWRIVAPIHNTDGRIVAYTGRTLNDAAKPRWKMSKNEEITEDPKKLLYGIDKIQDRVLIVEGPSDVWRIGPGAVALLGIDWYVEQVHILRKIPHRFIMFDPEPQAQRQARKLASWLAPFPGETEIITGLKTDPGALSQHEADSIVREIKLRTF